MPHACSSHLPSVSPSPSCTILFLLDPHPQISGFATQTDLSLSSLHLHTKPSCGPSFLLSLVVGGFLLPCRPIVKPSNTPLTGLLPQARGNALRDGAISSTAIRQYKNSELTAQSLFHLRFDCNGIACCPWESSTPTNPWPLWHETARLQFFSSIQKILLITQWQ